MNVESHTDRDVLDLIEACVRRLKVEYPERFVLVEIVAAVTQAHADLAYEVPFTAMPELTERLARIRLLSLSDEGDDEVSLPP